MQEIPTAPDERENERHRGLSNLIHCTDVQEWTMWDILQDEIDNIKSNMDKELSESYTIEDDILPYLSICSNLEEIEEVYV